MPETLERVRIGNPCRYGGKRDKTYGREVPVAAIDEKSEGRRVLFIKSFRRRLREVMADEPAHHRRKFFKKVWRRKGLKKVLGPIFPILASGGRVVEFVARAGILNARLSYDYATVLGWQDAKGRILLNPPLRKSSREYVSPFAENEPSGVRQLAELSPAEAWYELGLIDEKAFPTRRGIAFSFFSRGEGLAIAAALEDETYPVEDLVRDLANLRAGHRFKAYAKSDCRLAFVCRQAYGFSDCPGYLKNGVPLEYGEGAAEVLRERAESGLLAKDSLDEELRLGDVERARIEWMSLLGLIGKAPEMEWSRWEDLRKAAVKVSGSVGPRQSLPELPPIPVRQRRRHEPKSIRG